MTPFASSPIQRPERTSRGRVPPSETTYVAAALQGRVTARPPACGDASSRRCRFRPEAAIPLFVRSGSGRVPHFTGLSDLVVRGQVTAAWRPKREPSGAVLGGTGGLAPCSASRPYR